MSDNNEVKFIRLQAMEERRLQRCQLENWAEFLRVQPFARARLHGIIGRFGLDVCAPSVDPGAADLTATAAAAAAEAAAEAAREAAAEAAREAAAEAAIRAAELKRLEELVARGSQELRELKDHIKDLENQQDQPVLIPAGYVSGAQFAQLAARAVQLEAELAELAAAAAAEADLQGQLGRIPLPSGDSRFNRNVIRADAKNLVRVWVTDSEGERREFRGDVRSSFRVAEEGCGLKVDEHGEFKDFFPASCNVLLAESPTHAKVAEAKWAWESAPGAWKRISSKGLNVHLVVSNFWPVVNTSRRPVDANSQVDHTHGQKRDNRARRLAYTGGNSDNVNKPENGFRHPDGSYHEEPWLFDGVTTPYMPDCQTLFPLESVKWGKKMRLEVGFPF